MLKHIDCIPTGVHPGSRRFPDRHDRPGIKAWRCELTALSQLYNLYFLACNDTIHVYQPSFPDQNLSSEPELILHPPVSPETGPGIDSQDPHSITRILVEYLGSEEILLVACDDGDVVGYRVQEIQRALERRSTSSDELNVANEESIKVFLHRNVGASAWGLDVHREARIIAISANTHKVTVLAYALANHTYDSYDDEFVLPSFEVASDFPFPRQKDHVITLSAETNIPAVSFVNNGDDPEGRWLFSSSINGKTILWDIHHPENPARVFQLGWCASAKSPTRAPGLMPGFCSCQDRGNVPHGAWGAMMLDTRSAYEISPADELLLEPQEIAPSFKDVTAFKKWFSVQPPKVHYTNSGGGDFNTYDVSSDEADDSSAMAMSVAGEESDDSTTGSDSGSLQDDVLEQGTDSDSDAMSFDDEVQDTHGGEQDVSNEDDEEGHYSEQAEQGGDGHDDDDDVNVQVSETLPDTTIHSDSLFVPETQAQPQPQPATPPNLTIEQVWQPLATDIAEMMWNNMSDDSEDDEELFMPTGIHTQSIVNSIRMSNRKPYCEFTHPHSSSLPIESPVSPCLIFTKEEMFLLHRPFPATTDYSSHPIISMRRPLHPGPWAPFLGSHDRLCFFTQIPELGAFVVASPLGRAAVFSVYWTKQKGDGSPQYGFRLEYLLPFEQDNEREVKTIAPTTRLLGVAVSPVQGMFDGPGDVEERYGKERVPRSRRWRLLMYYTDHTVLSFELAKRRLGDSPGLSELIV